MLRLGGVALRLQKLPRASTPRAILYRNGIVAFSSTALDTSATPPRLDHQEQQVPSRVYHALVEQNALTLDRAQAHVLRKYLDKLHKQLSDYTLPELDAVPDAPAPAPDTESASTSAPAEPQTPPPQAERKSVLVPRGLYIHGSVGTGKSMLMDLFFANVATAQKRRVHFNKFMLEVHERIQKHKQAQLARYGRQRHIDLDPSKDVITRVAEEIARESHVLCFDEFQVTDIADALIMRKLFGVFFARGVVMVATSNTPPQVQDYSALWLGRMQTPLLIRVSVCLGRACTAMGRTASTSCRSSTSSRATQRSSRSRPRPTTACSARLQLATRRSCTRSQTPQRRRSMRSTTTSWAVASTTSRTCACL